MNIETLELAKEIIKKTDISTQVDLLFLVTAMPIPEEDKLQIITSSLAVAVDVMIDRSEYFKQHMDKIEKKLEQITKDLNKIANLL